MFQLTFQAKKDLKFYKIFKASNKYEAKAKGEMLFPRYVITDIKEVTV